MRSRLRGYPATSPQFRRRSEPAMSPQLGRHPGTDREQYGADARTKSDTSVESSLRKEVLSKLDVDECAHKLGERTFHVLMGMIATGRQKLFPL